MTPETLLRAIGDIDDAAIAEAAPDAAPHHPAWWRPVLVVAIGLALVAAVVAAGVRLSRTDPVAPGTEPTTRSSTTSRPSGLTLAIGEATSVSITAVDMALFPASLSTDQITTVLPDLGVPLGGAAWYTMDGALSYVSVQQTTTPDDASALASCGAHYACTTIDLSGSGAVPSDVIMAGNQALVTDVGGVPVASFWYAGDPGVRHYQSDFVVGGVAYRIALTGTDPAADAARLGAIVAAIIAGPPPDLAPLQHPDFPDLRNDDLTLVQAQGDPVFGAYIPSDPPAGWSFDSARRTHNPARNDLDATWTNGDGTLMISASAAGLTPDVDARTVHPDEKAKYDLRLYPIPWSDSIPSNLWDVVQNPVFLPGEITSDVVAARVYTAGEPDSGVPQAQFSVLYGDVLVYIDARGLDAEQLWAVVQQLG